MTSLSLLPIDVTMLSRGLENIYDSDCFSHSYFLQIKDCTRNIHDAWIFLWHKGLPWNRPWFQIRIVIVVPWPFQVVLFGQDLRGSGQIYLLTWTICGAGASFKSTSQIPHIHLSFLQRKSDHTHLKPLSFTLLSCVSDHSPFYPHAAGDTNQAVFLSNTKCCTPVMEEDRIPCTLSSVVWIHNMLAVLLQAIWNINWFSICN